MLFKIFQFILVMIKVEKCYSKKTILMVFL